MAHTITKRNQKRGVSELKTALAISIVSEILLVVGILLTALGVYVGVNNQVASGGCGLLGCWFYTSEFLTQVFYLGLGLLIASAIGFLLVFRLTMWSGTPN